MIDNSARIDEQGRCDRWNATYPIGTNVRHLNNLRLGIYTTSEPATVDKNGQAIVYALSKRKSRFWFTLDSLEVVADVETGVSLRGVT